MLFTRKNPKGGRKLTKFPIEMDQPSGNMGFKLGYCGGCNEPILVRFTEAAEIAQEFVGGLEKFNNILGTMKKQAIKIPLRVRIAQWAYSKLNDNEKDHLKAVELERDFH